MIKKIKKIKRVGLFNDAVGARNDLGQVTLIYADNGRGKSTLTNILRSLSSGDPAGVIDRETVGSGDHPEVQLLFDGNRDVKFVNGAWSESRPEIRIFDVDFILSHVHAGTHVTPEQRKNLLDFALGERAIAVLAREASASDEQRATNADIRQIRSTIEAHAGGVPFAVFRSTPEIDDAVKSIEILQARKAAAGRITALKALPRPSFEAPPAFDLEHVLAVLKRTIDDHHDEAEKRVSAHVRQVNQPTVGDWIAAGQGFDASEHCPFCGQPTDGNDLIQMYRLHFNDQYRNHLANVQDLGRQSALLLGDGFVDHQKKARTNVNQLLAAWTEHIELPSLPAVADDRMSAAVRGLGDLLGELIARKTVAPAESVCAVGDEAAARELWDSIVETFADDAAIIASANAQIDGFLSTILAEDSQAIDAEIARYKTAATRHSLPIVEQFSKLDEAESRLQVATLEKDEARASLDALMTSTLDRFGDAINEHLRNLSAGFKITSIRTNYNGGTPRTDYAIELRGEEVRLGGGRPTFATALSEADKRTLAFAFFAATTLDDANLHNQIVVIDDPISSFDRSRRWHTLTLLMRIAASAKQLVVLAHDPYCLLDLRDRLNRASHTGSIVALKITREAAGFSGIGTMDLEAECESKFNANYRLVSDFADGARADQAREAATALRPILEAHLHRRFPGHLGRSQMLGQAISSIETADGTSPLRHAISEVSNLRELNEFASQFHHDTNPDFQTARADPQEVGTYAKRVLAVVHGG